MVISILLDTCALWPSEGEEKKAVNKLFDIEEKSNSDEIIERYIDNMEIAEATEEELRQLKRIPEKLRKRYFSRCTNFHMANTFKERERIREIKHLLFPFKNSLSLSDERDCMILFTADKYRHTHFITVDKKHFINNRMGIKIFNKYKIKVMTPSKCLQEVQTHIQNMKAHKERMEKVRGI